MSYGAGRSDRAAPRKRKDAMEEHQPQFLRKAYYMIENCNPDIACWSAAGDSFIIKDTNRFTEEIIPTVYKHNKFTSFVRQLNFYGFRKVRSDLNQSALWWEFKHPMFIRGQPELLVEIKKSVHFEQPASYPSAEVISQMKDEMNMMRDQMRMMENMMREMAMRSNERASIGIAPHHVGMTATTGQYSVPHPAPSVVGSMGGGVSIGIPLNMAGAAPPSTKKRQRVSSNADVVPMLPALGTAPQFANSILPGDISSSSAQRGNAVPDRPQRISDMSSFDDPEWDEVIESFFDGGVEDTVDEHEQDDDEADDMGLDDGVPDSSEMFVVPATIVMNEQPSQHWEWAAVGQVLDTAGQQNCQVDQLADALLFSSIEPQLGVAQSVPANCEINPGNDLTSDQDVSIKTIPSQLDSLQNLGNIDALISGLLLLPEELQNRFVDRLADVLGKQLADHLARQADEVHLAMVEASYGQAYYTKKDENLMDVSHYAQVITSSSNPATPVDQPTSMDSMPTTVASHIPSPTVGQVADSLSSTSTEVHAMAHVIGTAASTMNHTLPFVMDYQTNLTGAPQAYTVPVASTIVPNFENGSQQIPMSRPASQHAMAPSAPPLPNISNTPVTPTTPVLGPEVAQSRPVNPTSCFPCENCAHCRANALIQSYQPQQLAASYPLAAAALGALVLRWGQACTRHQT